jgi:type I restriction enzyme S subunit
MSVALYPDYKDSGVEWIGEMPSHWDQRRLGNYLAERREKVSDKEFPPLSVTKNGIVPQLDNAAKTDDGDNRKKVCAGDFVINGRSDRKGSSGLSSLEGSVSLINIVLRPHAAVEMRFIGWLLKSALFQEEFYRYGKGIVADLWSTNFSEMRNIVLAMPPVLEQSAIAAFLDLETGKIDALVAEQERLMALLKEKRQAVISQAVTKGLNPNAPMKDSGIEWLGQVPAHWRVGKAGFYLDVLSGFAFPSEGFSEDEQATRLLRGINVSVGEIRWDDVVYWHRRLGDQLERYLLRQGDLVIGMDRPWIAAGVRVARLGENDTPCLLLQRVARLSVNGELSDEYLYSLLASDFFIAHFSPDMTGVSVPHISPDQIKSFVIPIPAIPEQHAIISHLKTVVEEIDTLITEATQAITLLRERRAALVTPPLIAAPPG